MRWHEPYEPIGSGTDLRELEMKFLAPTRAYSTGRKSAIDRPPMTTRQQPSDFYF